MGVSGVFNSNDGKAIRLTRDFHTTRSLRFRRWFWAFLALPGQAPMPLCSAMFSLSQVTTWPWNSISLVERHFDFVRF